MSSGYLEFERARVRWFLSINYDLIPEEINIKEIKNDKLRYFFIEEDPENHIDISIAVGFNDDVAVLLLSSKDEYEENWVDNISSILKGESKNNIISTKPGFTDIYNFDIGIWNDLSWTEDLKDLLTESEPDDDIVAYLKDLYLYFFFFLLLKFLAL